MRVSELQKQGANDRNFRISEYTVRACALGFRQIFPPFFESFLPYIIYSIFCAAPRCFAAPKCRSRQQPYTPQREFAERKFSVFPQGVSRRSAKQNSRLSFALRCPKGNCKKKDGFRQEGQGSSCYLRILCLDSIDILYLVLI